MRLDGSRTMTGFDGVILADRICTTTLSSLTVALTHWRDDDGEDCSSSTCPTQMRWRQTCARCSKPSSYTFHRSSILAAAVVDLRDYDHYRVVLELAQWEQS